jgi:hypothetical protein
VTTSEWPSWDVVVGDEAVHYLPVDATPDEAKVAAAAWLGERYGDGAGLVWEPAGESAFLGRWLSAR